MPRGWLRRLLTRSLAAASSTSSSLCAALDPRRIAPSGIPGWHTPAQPIATDKAEHHQRSTRARSTTSGAPPVCRFSKGRLCRGGQLRISTFRCSQLMQPIATDNGMSSRRQAEPSGRALGFGTIVYGTLHATCTCTCTCTCTYTCTCAHMHMHMRDYYGFIL